MQFLSFALIFASALMFSQIQATPASGLYATNTFEQESHVLKRAESSSGTDSNTMDGPPTDRTSTSDKLGLNAGNLTDIPEKTASTTNSDEDQIKAAKEAITKQKKVTKAEWQKFQDEEDKLQKMTHDLVVLEMKSHKPPTMSPTMGPTMGHISV
ncbi:uncharacterized protein MELLADRAFT_101965 [Melampsora larici-populina 98AG31]|uniref:Secreted protein n=1 Tax=Melampsora larici-populina (strain 98AG31 / pathotype 3-4-7) TaxID=747676 RepID=F4R5I7_MELLP|nr:uncharacterized protein MELLADRAFT_101965 [Melampsora larici-populina 98AG31]EGG12257.1 secreted protein [Melampsora larici-populina 98AG31]